MESCNGTSKIISVIYRPPSEISNCSSIDDDYRVVIFHHDFQIPTNIMKHSSPERYNDTACLVRLTLSPDISDKENNNTLLQVWMMLSSKPPILYCSNNFTLQVDTGNALLHNNALNLLLHVYSQIPRIQLTLRYMLVVTMLMLSGLPLSPLLVVLSDNMTLNSMMNILTLQIRHYCIIHGLTFHLICSIHSALVL